MDVNSARIPAGNEPKKLLDDESVTNAIKRNAENAGDCRRFLRTAGLGAVAAGTLVTAGAG